MNAVEFFKTRARMCKAHEDCPGCPLEIFCGRDYEEQGEADCIIKGVNAVEQWAKEHPVKTRQSEFLKMFPNAQKSSNGVLDICPRKFNPEKYKGATPDKICINDNADDEYHCGECCRDFWLKEID